MHSQTWVQRLSLGPQKMDVVLKMGIGQTWVQNFVVIIAGLGIQASCYWQVAIVQR